MAERGPTQKFINIRDHSAYAQLASGVFFSGKSTSVSVLHHKPAMTEKLSKFREMTSGRSPERK